MSEKILIDQYLKKILEKNKSINLTNIVDYEQARILHVQDSLFVLPEFKEAPEGLYADIGTGAGFPGVPLALETGRHAILIDSVEKKIRCVQSVLDDLNIDHIKTYAGRIEDYARLHPCSCSVVTARALAQLSILMELSAPLLEDNGVLIAFKADIKEEEIQHALQLQEKLGLQLESERSGYLEGNKRTVIVFRKVNEPQIKLPRKPGFAQKKPL